MHHKGYFHYSHTYTSNFENVEPQNAYKKKNQNAHCSSASFLSLTEQFSNKRKLPSSETWQDFLDVPQQDFPTLLKHLNLKSRFLPSDPRCYIVFP